jgi:hypothetical protein
VPDKTPEERMTERIKAATTHAQLSLNTYQQLALSALDHSLSKDSSKQAALSSDVVKIWAQTLRDAAFGWATWSALMTDYSKVAPPPAAPEEGGPE